MRQVESDCMVDGRWMYDERDVPREGRRQRRGQAGGKRPHVNGGLEYIDSAPSGVYLALRRLSRWCVRVLNLASHLSRPDASGPFRDRSIPQRVVDVLWPPIYVRILSAIMTGRGRYSSTVYIAPLSIAENGRLTDGATGGAAGIWA